jgi:hypothetical protein
MRAGLQQGLNRRLSSGLSVEGTVDSLRVDGIAATREALVVQASATGSAALRVIHY